ncbi:MAG: cell division protein ZipA [Gammaproteobacteria bacterium]|nr:cell division protein ZipA [Gammaproteobacteria bacterium]
MSPRELIIFLLGLATAAAILRGLYIAIQARRDQIKLVIDKNIPQDVDLDALELSELPGGGARVVERSLRAVNSQNSAIEAANARSASLGLGIEKEESTAIPVLMDTVELTEEVQLEEQELDTADNKENFTTMDQEGFQVEENLVDVSYEKADLDNFSSQREVSYEDPDDVLFDYFDEANSPPLETVSKDVESEDLEEADEIDEIDVRNSYAEDGMAAVMPDYPENEWADDNDEEEDEIPDGFHEEEFGGSSDSEDLEGWAAGPEFREDVGGSDETSSEEDLEDDDAIIAAFKQRQISKGDDFESGFDNDELAHLDIEDCEDEHGNRLAPTIGASFEDSLDEFSMSAGDRIGYQATESERENQSDLFDIDTDAADNEHIELSKGAKVRSGIRSLISAFGRPKQKEIDHDASPIEEAQNQSVHIALEDNSDLSASDFSESDLYEEDNVSNFEDAVASSNSTSVEEPIRVDSSVEQESIQQSEVLIVNVMARDRRVFEGHDLLQALVTSGLKFGEMNIFHHRLNNGNTGPVIFSVANILNPGTFDLNQMDSFSTIGISFFLALPTQINNLQAFEQMLEVAQQIRGALDGELKDDHRNVMTAQTIEHYYQRIRDFELHQLKATGSRG